MAKKSISGTDCESQFNDTFLGNEELDNLW